LLQGLRDLGYVDGRNVVIHYRFAAALPRGDVVEPRPATRPRVPCFRQ
jgi:hypothetical protein